jgi:hypothetical protein
MCASDIETQRRRRCRFGTAIAVLGCFTGVAASGAVDAPTNAIPRLHDGRPDLNGTWDNGGGIHFVQPTKNADGSICVRDCGGAPPPREPPDRPKYKPELLAKVKQLDDQQVKLDPGLRCQPPGVPRIGPPDKIVQTSKEIVFLYDDITGPWFRVVKIGGKHVPDEIEESFFGTSVAHWEGDTLVVETIGFNTDTWLADDGAFHSDKLRVVERLRRIGNTIEFDVLVEDPEVLAEPWRMRRRILELSKTDLPPPVPCHEQDLSHVVDGTHHDNLR